MNASWQTFLYLNRHIHGLYPDHIPGISRFNRNEITCAVISL
ncbi:hypothetical protein D083_1551 [Dickeya solani RNS 08.23.3.1.A]|nr:hypothetical protein D083_1551 [Dickeya solani RNS 08.23.3.1.A]